MTATIEIGTNPVHRIPITAQSHARLRHLLPQILTDEELGQLTDTVEDQDGARQFASTVAGWTGKAYAVLTVLAPALATAMPEHVWQGYGSPEAMAAGEYVEADDHAPTVAQQVDAFETALEVNGIKKLGTLLRMAGDAQSLFGGQGDPPAPGRP